MTLFDEISGLKWFVGRYHDRRLPTGLSMNRKSDEEESPSSMIYQNGQKKRYKSLFYELGSKGWSQNAKPADFVLVDFIEDPAKKVVEESVKGDKKLVAICDLVQGDKTPNIMNKELVTDETPPGPESCLYENGVKKASDHGIEDSDKGCSAQNLKPKPKTNRIQYSVLELLEIGQAVLDLEFREVEKMKKKVVGDKQLGVGAAA